MCIIRTSFYFNVKDKYDDYKKIAISLSFPYGEADMQMKELAPDLATLSSYKLFPNEYKYTREYNAKLKKLLKEGKLDDLVAQMKSYDKVILLCYEGKGKFCHRHLLADFLNENYKLNIREL